MAKTMRSEQAGVAVIGADAWLRQGVLRGIAERGFDVTDKGRGSASLRGVGTLVVLPSVAPARLRSGHDTGMGALGVTLSAAVTDNVKRVVVLSRVGAGTFDSGYFTQLARLEHQVKVRVPETTILRVTHPIGAQHDAGPIAAILRRLSVEGHTDGWEAVTVQPVCSDDVIAALVAAATSETTNRRVMELGGPMCMSLSDLADLVSLREPSPRRRQPLNAVHDRMLARRVRSFLTFPSVARNAPSDFHPGRGDVGTAPSSIVVDQFA